MEVKIEVIPVSLDIRLDWIPDIHLDIWPDIGLLKKNLFYNFSLIFHGKILIYFEFFSISSQISGRIPKLMIPDAEKSQIKLSD